MPALIPDAGSRAIRHHAAGVRGVWLTCALAVVWLAFAAGAAEGASSPARLAILTNSQRKILDKNRVKVRVSARQTGALRVFGTVRGAVATRVKSVKVARGRSRVVSLSLNKAGVREMRGCSKRKLTVQGAIVSRGRPGKAARYSRTVRADSKTCRKRGGGGSGGGGSAAARPRVSRSRSTSRPRTPTAATSSTRRSACSRSRTTTSPADDSRPPRAGGSTSTLRRCRATAAASRSSRRDYNRNDGFSPGAADRHQGPRGSTTRRPSTRTGAVPITDMARAFDAGPAGRRDQRADARAAPDLGRDRRQPGGARGREPDHPPGVELRGGRALHRRAAAAEGRDGQDARGAGAGFRALPRRRPDHERRGRGAPAALREHLPDARRGRHRPRRPLPGLGLHGGERAEPVASACSTSATTRSRSWATRTWPT